MTDLNTGTQLIRQFKMADIKTQSPPVKKKAQAKRKTKTPADINLAIVLEAIHEICDTNCKAHEDLREIFHEGLKGVQLNIDANASVTNEKLESIDRRFETLNGTVARLQKESDGRKQAVTDLYEHIKSGNHRPWQWIKRNWWLALLIFITFVTLIFVILERFGIVGVMNAVKEVKDVL